MEEAIFYRIERLSSLTIALGLPEAGDASGSKAHPRVFIFSHKETRLDAEAGSSGCWEHSPTGSCVKLVELIGKIPEMRGGGV